MANIVYMAKSAWTGLLDSIRSKAGTAGTMTVSQATDAVDSITGGDDSFQRLIDRNIQTVSDRQLSIIGEYAFAMCPSLTSVYFENVQSISKYAFASCMRLSSITFPNAILIAEYAFTSAFGATHPRFSFPKVEVISSYAFYSANAERLDFPMTSQVGEAAFKSCRYISFFSFPELITVGSSAFYGISSYSTTIDLPKCISIRYSGFAYCSKLKGINLPVVASIDAGAFFGCTSMSYINAPSVQYIGGSTFYNCSALESVSFPTLSYTVTGSLFGNCRALSVAHLGGSFTSIAAGAFKNCYNLLSLYLSCDRVVSLASPAVFDSTPISNYTASTGGVYGSIYVPASLYDGFLSATAWSYFASRFVSIQE